MSRFWFSVALELKRLELLRELISSTPLIALLINPNNVTATAARRQLNDATRGIGQDMVVLEASTEGEFEAVFATLTQKRAGALVVSDDALFANRRSGLERQQDQTCGAALARFCCVKDASCQQSLARLRPLFRR